MKNYLKIYKRLLTAMAFWGLWGMGSQAQEMPVATDSIPIQQLLTQVEKHIGVRIFTTLTDSFLVKKLPEEELTLARLRETLAKTPWKVNEYDGKVYVLRNQELFPDLPITWVAKSVVAENGNVVLTETIVSENKVYDIGNKNRPSQASKVKLTGQVIDFRSGEPQMGIHVIQRSPWNATTTDVDGRFTIELKPGYNVLELQGLNIKETRRQLMVHTDADIRIELEEQNHMLEEVVVTGGRLENIKNVALGMEKIQPSLLKNIPTALGEVDVLKMVQTLPGVKTVGEASSGYNVRGGSTDQNLMLLNGGTIYNPTHMFGFFTAFNSDMVADVELYKSSIPSEYGGRISSVLNITGKEASKEKFSGVAGIGLLTSKLNLEITFGSNIPRCC